MLKHIKLNNLYFISIIFIRINIFDCECSEDSPFLRGTSCSTNYCKDSELSSGTCSIDNTKVKTQWLNDIIVFHSTNYRAGKFALDVNGNMVAEYSSGNKRLFYGLKTDGNYYFDGNPIKIISDINGKRYESNIIFISLENDIAKTKQYLFSVATHDSVMELHDLENNNHCTRNVENYLGHRMLSFVSPLLEFKKDNKNVYLWAYTYNSGNEFKLKTFYFPSFSLDNISQKNNPYYNNYNVYSRILSAYITTDNIIVLFFLNRDPNSENNNKYVINIYGLDLSLKNEKVAITSTVLSKDNYNIGGEGIFFKAIYLKDKFGAFIFYTNRNDGKSLNLRLGKVNYNYNDNIFERTCSKAFNEYAFNANIMLNDFQKFDENRVVFIGTSSDYQNLYILIIDLFNNYKNIKERVYKSKLYEYKVILELSTVIFNNYLVFTSTVVSSTASNNEDKFSILMIFGYANGTDATIDISPYFMDDMISNENNIVTKLIEGISIDNNIFGYVVLEKIKLVTIPDEIIFYDSSSNQLLNGNILEKEYTFYQNNNLIKTDKLYSLEYQFIVEEPASFTDYTINIINEPSDASSYVYKKNQFYGRKNTAKFKLCHDFCASCKKLSKSNDTQLCLTCLESYQYDYFNDFLTNCVPENYFKDKEDNYKLVECDNTNSHFYINLIKFIL